MANVSGVAYRRAPLMLTLDVRTLVRSRGLAVLGLLAGLLVVSASSASGAAVAAPGPPLAGPSTRCTLADERLAEVSGLVADPDGPRVVNDSGNPSTVYRLDGRCAVAGTTAVPEDGTDVEDLAREADGTLWLADTGDNRRQRPTVAMLRLSSGGADVATRLAYVDGPHDAEALLLGVDGRPVLVTKDIGGRSGVYTTDAPLPDAAGAEPVALRRVGEVALPPTATPGGGADPTAVALGGGLITGGAVSADGRVAALRTYTDAWIYPVTGYGASADALVAALRGRPVQVPLPGEPQGEAIAFTADGTLLSAGESPEAVGPAATSRRGTLRAVPGATGVGQRAGTPTPAPPVPRAAPASTSEDDSMSSLLWTGVGVAVVAGGGGVLVALRSWRR